MPPAFVGSDPASATSLRAFYYGKLWRHWNGRQRAAALVLAAAKSVGTAGEWLGGNSYAPRACWAGFSASLLRDLAGRRHAGWSLDAFVDQEERKGLHLLLNPTAVPFDRNLLKNKTAFAAHCANAGLPAPRSVSGVDAPAGGMGALIAKPQYGSKGKDVQRLVRLADGDWQLAGGAGRLRPDDLDGWIRRANDRGLLVQECLAVDPSLADISPGALPTLRVVTCRDEHSVPEVTDVALRLSLSADGAADNFNADNLVCGVDGRGQIGPALRRLDSRLVECASHPLTGAPIEGELLQLWPEALALAVRAHEAICQDFTVVGWDIGLTARGAVFVEGNWNPGYNVMQLVHGRGLGDTRLGALYRFHLDRLADCHWNAARPLQFAQWPGSGR